MNECECPVPRPNDRDENNRRSADYCGACGRRINPAWTANDSTTSEFMDRLGMMFPGRKPDAWRWFRIDCEAREVAGRPKFGHSFLGRNNLKEAQEEACDLALYSMLDTLVIRRAGRDQEDIDLALTAAQKAYEAYEALNELRAKRAGSP